MNYGHFIPWLAYSKSVRTNKKLDRSTQAKFAAILTNRVWLASERDNNE